MTQWMGTRAAVLLLLSSCLVAAVPAGTLQVTVLDARDRQPISGAFVMVGPVKGIPFPGNTGKTPPSGTITFQHPAITGPQTVTAGASDYGYSAVIDAADTSLQLQLYPIIPDTMIHGPASRVTGRVTNIATVPNDGNLDIALVIPSVSVDQFLGGGNLPYVAPPDSMNIPLVGWVKVPGNLYVPSQQELFVTISKPDYKMDLKAQTTQDLYALTVRVPLDVLLNPPPGFDLIHYANVREFGIERARAIGNGLNLDINSDFNNLPRQLTVRVLGAPAGANVTGTSLGSLGTQDGSEMVVGYDLDTALADTTDSVVLTSLVPGGDMSDVTNFCAGGWQDSSAYLAFGTGKIDRTPITLPTTKTFGDLYDPPVVTRSGARFSWNAVHGGTEPAPTWALATITLGPTVPTDSTVQIMDLWRVAVPAGLRSFVLPSLPAEAPGYPAGLVDVAGTPDNDRLIFTLWVGNPSGTINDVLLHPFVGVSHFSQRRETLGLRPSDIEDPSMPREVRLRVRPNPATGEVRIDLAAAGARAASIEVIDPSGRRLRALPVAPGQTSVLWDGCDEAGRSAPPGLYLIRIDGEGGAQKLLMVR
jgi:hypothetical protein